MKVIKHGNLLKYKEHEVNCDRCGCIYLYLLSDLTCGVTYDSKDKVLVPYRYVRCPECFTVHLHQEGKNPAATPVDTPSDPDPVYDEDGNEEL